VVLPKLLDWAHHILISQIVRKGDSVRAYNPMPAPPLHDLKRP